MALVNGAPAGRGRKRKADDVSNLMSQLAEIDLKKTPPYDPRTERAPQSVLQSKEWDILNEGNDFIHELVTMPFKESDFESKATVGLLKMIEDTLLHFKEETIVVGISGNMGGGKSSTLNSLLQVGSIALSGATGGSCTLASNYYNPSKSDQKEPLLAEVVFFNHGERREILASYLRDYYRAFRGASDDDGEQKPARDEDGSENPTIRDEVVNVMVSLFKDQRECRTRQDVRSFLEDAESEDDHAILGKLIDFSDTLVRRTHGGNGVVTVTASTAGELLTKLERYSKEADAEDDTSPTSLWPFVAIIKFCLNDPLINHGINFLDTPGLTDLNRTRRMSAQKWAKKKTHALIVTEASRAQDDASVPAEVRTMKFKGKNKVIIVTPKSDDMDPKTIPSGSRKEKEQIKRFANTLNQLQIEAGKMDDRILECDDNDDYEESVKLSRHKAKLDILIKQTTNQEKAHRINMRSQHTQKKLSEKLEDVKEATSTIPIIPISNSIYIEHLNGFSARDTPVLSVEETNIPELRRRLFAFPNEARLSEARYKQEHVMPSLLTRLELYVTQSASDRKAELGVYVAGPIEHYERELNQAFEDFTTRLDEVIIKPLGSGESAWIQGARTLCVAWDGMFKTGPFLTLMNRQGLRRAHGRKTFPVNMNGDLIDLSSAVNSRLFEQVAQSVISFSTTMEEDMREHLEGILRKINEICNGAYTQEFEPFIKFLNSQKPGLLKCVRDARGRLEKQLDLIRRKVITTDDDAYLVEAMLPIYEAVASLKAARGGPKTPRPKEGFPALRKATFQLRVTQPNSVHAAVVKGVTQDLAALLEQEKDRLKTELGVIFRDIQENFVLNCSEEVEEDPGEEKLKVKLGENLKQAEQHLKVPMQEACDSLHKRFR